MRRFETIELAAVILAVFLPVVLGTRLKRGRMAAILVVAMLAQWIFEGFRWQLIPLHLSVVVMAFTDFGWETRGVRGYRRFRRGTLGVVGVALLAALPVLLPVPHMPRPTGSFQVGTATFVLDDPQRVEQYGLAPDQPAPSADDPAAPHRRIVVQAWYPATVADGAEPIAWDPDWDVVGPALSRHLGFPGFFLSHLDGVPSNSYATGAPMSGRFPVLIYSHGWTGFRDIAINQVESLASRGYLVLAADHTYGAIVTRFPDTGEVVPFDPAALPDEETTDAKVYAKATEQLVDTFAGDVELIMDQLAEGTDGQFGSLAEHADATRFGLWGHSTGGGAVVEVCIQDDRCAGVLGLDAWVTPISDRVVAKDLTKPALFIRSGPWQGTENDARLRGIADRDTQTAWWVGIADADHNDMVVTPLFSPIADRLGLKGPISSDVVVPMLDRYLNGFFDRVMLGVDPNLLDRPAQPGSDLELIP